MIITLEQIRAARAMLGLKQQELAKKAGVSTGTLNNIERGVQTDPKLSTLKAIQAALEADGIEFTETETGALGIRLRPHTYAGEKPTLLIIDDSHADRTLYKSWLGAKPYRIIEAANAKDGYAAFIQTSPACIILDFMMYGKNGFQLLVEMQREHTTLPPILFVTSMHSDVVEQDAVTMGVHTYLNKQTLTRERLCQAVEEAMAHEKA